MSKQIRKKSSRTAKQSKPALPPEALDCIPRVSVTFTDESVYVTRFDPAGRPVTTFPVATDDVAAAMRPFGADTGLLPLDALFWQSQGSAMRIGIWLPPTKMAITVASGGQRGEESITIPLPGMIFVGQGVRYWIYAAVRRPHSTVDLLYHAPLSNVHTDGLICAGEVKFPRCTPDVIHTAVQLFFESVFNYDLSADKIVSNGDSSRRGGGYDVREMVAEPGDLDDVDESDDVEGDGEGLWDFLRSLEGKRQFPVNRLLPTGKTIQQLISERAK